MSTYAYKLAFSISVKVLVAICVCMATACYFSWLDANVQGECLKHHKPHECLILTLEVSR